MEEQKKLEQPKKRNVGKKILFFFFLILVLFYIYMRYIEVNTIVVQEQAIVDQNLPSSFDGMKIISFSDILYGSTITEKNLDKVVQKINTYKPDIVLFTGDLLNDSIKLRDQDVLLLKEKLNQIEAKYKKYAVLGDNDYSDKEKYLEIMDGSGFFVLDNKNDFFYYEGKDPLLFIGTSSLLENENDVEQALTNEENLSSYYKIWLNHEPTILNQLETISPNLVFTGHTLNGLMSIPFKGFLLEQNGIDNYRENYYENNNTKMYISNGVGTYKYNIRFLNFPSISLYRLYSE